jgi:hypothetical protein
MTILCLGCETIFFEEEPQNSPETNFEIFWKDFDRCYGQFDIRQINWDSVYQVYRPRIKSGTTNLELFNEMKSIIQLLKDGHVNLYTPIGVAGYDSLYPINYSGNKLINAGGYINFSSIRNSAMEFGTIKSFNIGYIAIHTFYSNDFGNKDARFDLIDEAIKQFKEKDGIIIDIRDNGGGNSSNAISVSGRFADKKYLYYKQRYKNGPGKHDYSEWVNFYLEPQGENQFKKPVVVLTSKCTYSSAEVFVCAMSVLPQTSIMGDTTAGGVGNPVYRELPNGWAYRLSTSVGAMVNGTIIDGGGIIPQFPVVNLNNDINNDFMLEKGIEIILNSK